MNALIKVFKSHIHNGLVSCAPNLENASAFICDSHLDPDNYAMPVLNESASTVISLLEQGRFDEVEDKLTFEPTKTIRGVIRVMVRTHLNRQGVGHVSRGSADKTLAKRVLLPFENDFDYQKMLDHDYFAEQWEEALEAHPAEYDEIDRQSIAGLRKLRGGQRTNARVAKHLGIHDNWAKVFTGIYSGLQFLDNNYHFNAEALWSDMNACENDIEATKRLVKKVQTGIHQYGEALAGSFLADLGHAGFVKPDTHVISSVAAMCGRESVPSQSAVDYVYKLAETLSMEPRAVDKLFYLGCSGKLYLYNLGMKNPRQFKSDFLNDLGPLGQL
ncbi:hypothetical protein [Pseudidiomarina terrestris]|uniref:hypothetical protein n=1 Tax=Pseudidiomarina terrestris TaxID=2820060 RepID=UPI002652A7FD|nr:hypothetical protein [Pseudidiomarina sp. 1ASP75-5]MDN7135348.1 hypothetical protein [Pseudidiomarina sp. 1ASP75-5]